AALRYRYEQRLGKMLDAGKASGRWPVPYLRNADVQWDSVNLMNLPVIDISPSERNEYLLRVGDLLVCEGGDVGRAAIWSGEIEICTFKKALHRLRPRDARTDAPRFLMFALMCASRRGAFSDGHVSTIPHLTGEKLRAHRFPFPPILEQEL